MINNLVYSGVVVPGIIFGGLFLVPWIEQRLTGDDREHHLLDRPRDAPHRTAAGAAAITFVAVLFLGGSQDVIADTFDISIGHVTTILQISAIVGPPIAYFVTYRLCRSLPCAAGPERTERPAASSRPVRRVPRRPRRRDRRGRRPRAGRAGRARRDLGRSRRMRLPVQIPPPLTEQADDIDRIWNGFLLIAARRRLRSSPCSLIIVLVRFRRGKTTRHPAPVHQNIPIEIIYMVVPLLVVVGLFAVTFVSVRAIDKVDEDPDLVVDVTRVPVAVAVRLPGVGRARSSATADESPELVLPAGAVGALRPHVARRHPLVLDPRLPLQARHVPGPDARRSPSTSTIAHRRVTRTRGVRRVLRARPPQDAVLRRDRDAGRVRAVAARSRSTPRRTDHDGHRSDLRPRVESTTFLSPRVAGERRTGLPRTLSGWLTTTDHKAIGVAYALTSLVFLAHRRGAGRDHPRRAGPARPADRRRGRPTTASSRSTAA